MRTEAIVESFEASLREAFQQLQGGANAIPWWERKSLAQGMTESFVVGKRELETLRLAGKIEFIGPSKTGTYQLVGT